MLHITEVLEIIVFRKFLIIVFNPRNDSLGMGRGGSEERAPVTGVRIPARLPLPFTSVPLHYGFIFSVLVV